eukprot:3045677-Prorocentrum_lima.AAC.1
MRGTVCLLALWRIIFVVIAAAALSSSLLWNVLNVLSVSSSPPTFIPRELASNAFTVSSK